MMPSRKFLIKGRVQGVGFRYAARAQAMRLGLAGWVKNLPNGDVEVAACGASNMLAELEAWLRRGPDAADVREVTEMTDAPVMPGAPTDDDEFRML